jgi:hypothetical protein
VVTEIDGYITAALKRGGELSEPTRIRPPAGFETDGPAAQFAVRNGFQVIRRYSLPQAITTGRLVPWCAHRMTPFGPIHHWLVTHTN